MEVSTRSADRQEDYNRSDKGKRREKDRKKTNEE